MEPSNIFIVFDDRGFIPFPLSGEATNKLESNALGREGEFAVGSFKLEANSHGESCLFIISTVDSPTALLLVEKRLEEEKDCNREAFVSPSLVVVEGLGLNISSIEQYARRGSKGGREVRFVVCVFWCAFFVAGCCMKRYNTGLFRRGRDVNRRRKQSSKALKHVSVAAFYTGFAILVFFHASGHCIAKYMRMSSLHD